MPGGVGQPAAGVEGPRPADGAQEGHVLVAVGVGVALRQVDPVFPGEWLPMWVIGVFLDLFMGSVIVFIYLKYEDKPGKALVYSLLSILALLAPAAITFYWLATSLNVAPVMGGMVIHQMYETAKRPQNPKHALNRT